MCAVPTAGCIPIVIRIAVVVVATAVAVFMFAGISMSTAVVVIIAVVLFVTVPVVLGERDCGRKRQGKNCGCSGSKPGFRRQCTPPKISWTSL
jgi:hypothetical protein